ncbi:hypothetical protein LY76DRAFT_214860 [Colletotrichum caudatum]|nr:hypothetical protein LY76DRAFT_214860 [Colletotrichum caudatum]
MRRNDAAERKCLSLSLSLRLANGWGSQLCMALRVALILSPPTLYWIREEGPVRRLAVPGLKAGLEGIRLDDLIRW